MRLVRLIVNVSILVVMLLSVASAGGFDNLAVGTKARALGGAFTGLANDWTAAYYNPAGYAYLMDNSIGGNLALIHYRNELTPDYRWGGTYETGIFNDVANVNRHEILNAPSAGAVVRLPVWGETVFGFSIYQPFDYNITWELYRPLLAYNDNLVLPTDQYRNNLDVVSFQITAGRELNDEVALGLGVELLRGDLLFKSIVFRDNPMLSLDSTSPLATRPWDKVTQNNQNDGYGFGLGLRGGLLWKASEKLNVGVTAHLPFQITVSGEHTSLFVMPKNETLWQNSDSTAVSRVGTVGHLFAAGSMQTVTSDFDAKLKMPASFAVGFGYQLSEKLQMALDAKYTLWSTFDGFEFEYENFTGLSGPADTAQVAREFFTSNVTYAVDWDNTITMSLGAVYKVNPTLTMMLGGTMDQSPAKDKQQFSPVFVDSGTKYVLNGGLIVHIDRWDLGVSTSYTRYPSETVDVPSDFGASEDYYTFPGEYSGDGYETVLSFIYRF
jgi:long-chain fatty acid transport protein